MGYVRRSSASAIGAVVALLVAVSSAAAVEPTEFRLEQDQVPLRPCPFVNPTTGAGGCSIHGEGELTLTYHVFGIEASEAACHVEFEGGIAGGGVGRITSFALTNGAHGGSGCSNVAPACTGSLPWLIGVEEVAPSAVEAYFDACLETEVGTCDGGYLPVGLIEEDDGANGEERHHFRGESRPLGSSLCEASIEAETEMSPAHPDEMHIFHVG